MQQDAFIGLIFLCGLILPAIVWLILRCWGKLGALSPRLWLALYALGALMCVVVLPRKHLEAAIITHWPREYWAYTLTQIDNEIWEQVGKLVAMLIVLWLSGEQMRSLFKEKRTALAIGYWTGLCYGLGEALILGILFTWPQWSHFFGVKTFTLYLVGWGYVYERLWAMPIHAVMGALIGLGLYGLLSLGSKRRFVGFFLLAMLYHHFVDGPLFTAAFVPALNKILVQAGTLFVPSLLILGMLLLVLAYRMAGSRPQDVEQGSSPDNV